MPSQSSGSPDPELLKRIDELCGEFERLLHSNQPPQIADYLERVNDIVGQQQLFRELLLIELEAAPQSETANSKADYLVAFPEMADVVKDVFAMLDPDADEPTISQQAVEIADDGATLVQHFSDSAAAPDDQQTRIIKDYEILDTLGRGGMGVVYRARDQRLNRMVALKMILSAEHASAAHLERFQIEARTVARLHHPNIVQIFDVGQVDGCPYLTLELVEGRNLSQFASGVPQPEKLTARLVEHIARAVHYAHSQGVVHRDLKPSNILLAETSRSESGDSTLQTKISDSSTPSIHSADAQQLTGSQPSHASALSGTAIDAGEFAIAPKIADFGLAKQLDAESHQTSTNAIMGTPQYMAPEQAEGKTRDVTAACDIYSVGAIMYVLLTGRPPFIADSVMETLRLVMDADPVPPSRLRPKLAKDLETICMKCLEKAPAKRYSSAEALADDLRNYLTSQPISARPISKTERLVKLARRNPGVAKVTSLLIVVVICAIIGLAWFGQSEREQRLEAEAAREQERIAKLAESKALAAESAALAAESKALTKQRAANTAANDNLYTSTISQSRLLIDANDVDGAQTELQACRSKPEMASRIGWEWHYLDHQSAPELSRVGRHTDMAYYIVISPNGKYVGSAGGGNPYFASDDQSVLPGEAMIYERSTGHLLHQINHDHIVTHVVFSPDSRLVATAALDNTVKITDLESGDAVHSFAGKAAPDYVTDRGFVEETHVPYARQLMGFGTGVSSGRFIYRGAELGLHVFDLKTSTETFTLSGVTACFVISPDGKSLVRGVGETGVELWDMTSGAKTADFSGHSERCFWVNVSADGSKLLSATQNKEIIEWNMADQTISRRWDVPANNRYVCMTSPDESTLAYLERSAVRVLNLDDGSIRQLAGHEGIVRGLAFHPDSRSIATAGDDGTVRVWDVASAKQVETLRHRRAVHSAKFSSDGRDIATIGAGRDQRLWDATRSQRFLKFNCGYGQKTLCDLVLGDDNRVSIAFRDPNSSGMGQWDARTGGRLVKHPVNAINSLAHPRGDYAFSRDGKVLAAPEHPGRRTVRVWNVEDASERFALPGHKFTVIATAFSSTGERIVTADELGHVKVWDAKTGRQVTEIKAERASKSECETSLAGDEQHLSSLARLSWYYSMHPTDRDQQKAAEYAEASIAKHKRFELGFMMLALAKYRANDWAGALEAAQQGRNVADPYYFAIADFVAAMCLWQSGDQEQGRMVFDVAVKNGNRSNWSEWAMVLTLKHEAAELMGIKSDSDSQPNDWFDQPMHIESIAISPDGKLLAAGCRKSGIFRVWNVEDGSVRFAGFGGKQFLSVDFSSDSKLVAFGDFAASTVRVMDAESGEERYRVPGPRQTACLRFSPADGRPSRLAVVGYEEGIHLLDAHSGNTLLVLRGDTRHTEGFIPRVSFSPDGTKLAHNNVRGDVFVWDGTDFTDEYAEVRRQNAEIRRIAYHEREAASTEAAGANFAAVFHLSALIDESPKTEMLRVRRARALKQLGRDAEALKDYKRAVALGGDEYSPLLLTGLGESIEAPHVPFDQFEAFTIEAWVKDWDKAICCQGRQAANKQVVVLGMPVSGWQTAGANDTGYRVTPRSGWNHVAMVFDGKRQLGFINGKLSSEKEAPAPGPLERDLPLVIGRRDGNERSHATGFIRSLRVSKVARYTGDFTPKDELASDKDAVVSIDFARRDADSVQESVSGAKLRLINAWWKVASEEH